MVYRESTLDCIGKLIERLIRLEDVEWRLVGGPRCRDIISHGLDKLSVLHKTRWVDDNSIVHYLLYQVYRNRKSIAEGKFRVSWIFSDNAITKYKNQFLVLHAKSGMTYYMDQWLNEFELTREKLVTMIADPKPHPLRGMVDMPSEEPIKTRFYNTSDGLALCQTTTTGWSPFSEACKGCINQEECKRITSNKFPELVRFRLEKYGKEK